jgi:hypothetical protein
MRLNCAAWTRPRLFFARTQCGVHIRHGYGQCRGRAERGNSGHVFGHAGGVDQCLSYERQHDGHCSGGSAGRSLRGQHQGRRPGADQEVLARMGDFYREGPEDPGWAPGVRHDGERHLLEARLLAGKPLGNSISLPCKTVSERNRHVACSRADRWADSFVATFTVSQAE